MVLVRGLSINTHFLPQLPVVVLLPFVTLWSGCYVLCNVRGSFSYQTTSHIILDPYRR